MCVCVENCLYNTICFLLGSIGTKCRERLALSKKKYQQTKTKQRAEGERARVFPVEPATTTTTTTATESDLDGWGEHSRELSRDPLTIGPATQIYTRPQTKSEHRRDGTPLASGGSGRACSMCVSYSRGSRHMLRTLRARDLQKSMWRRPVCDGRIDA